jgi:hypothetical protein
VEGLADVLQAVEEPPGSGDVYESPLDDLAPAQSGPGALGFTLCRRVGQSVAPMASECSGIRSGCGCERGACSRLKLSSPPSRWLSAAGVWTKVLRRARSPHQRCATRSGGRAARAGVASWGIWKPGIRPSVAGSPGCQVPDFQFLARRRPRRAGERARAGAGGNLANWKPGTLGICAARRGAGRRGPAVARSARVGRTRAAAMASPMARRRASPAGAGMRLQRKPTPVLAKASTAQGWRGLSGTRAIDGMHCAIISR